MAIGHKAGWNGEGTKVGDAARMGLPDAVSVGVGDVAGWRCLVVQPVMSITTTTHAAASLLIGRRSHPWPRKGSVRSRHGYRRETAGLHHTLTDERAPPHPVMQLRANGSIRNLWE